jgi:hypothetical protein
MREIHIEGRGRDLRRQAVRVLGHDDRDDQVAGQRVPLAALGLDLAHGRVFAPRIGMRFVLGRVDEDHADAFAHGARDLALEIISAAELLGVDEEFVLVVEIRLQIAVQRFRQRGLEALHQRVFSVGVAEETAVPYRHCHSPRQYAAGPHAHPSL